MNYPLLSIEMFFLHELERTIILHPSFFGPKIPEYLIQQLLNDVEGKFMGSYYIIAVMDTFDISDGRVLPGSAHAEYTIHFKAIVWKPFKGEIVCESFSRELNYAKMPLARRNSELSG